jgi:AAA+ ATPase superfamily predicted ATPase
MLVTLMLVTLPLLEAWVADFVGRVRELALLRDEFERVRSGVGGERPGRCLMLRGRRRVGKSRLVETFVERVGVPSLFFTATGAASDAELLRLAEDAERSTLPERELLADARPADWAAAFRLLAAALPDDQPSVVVLDEVPYLMGRDDAFEGVLQRSWDRLFERKPVLLLLIGSDLSMMEALTAYDRPFHQRGREMVIGPLNPREIGQMLGLPAADAFDAALVTGGLPLICAEWPHGASVEEYLGQALASPISALMVSAERSLAAEFPDHTQARTVLGAIGTGERNFTNIANAAGGIGSAPLNRALGTLLDKRIVAGELPVSLRPSRDRRYRVTDPYLRFWLRFLGPHLDEVERGRGDITGQRIAQGWTSWRGRAVEPVVRDALARLLPDRGLPAAPVVGGYWTRNNQIEIDIVGADREPIAKELLFVGSIKWLGKPFDEHDRAALLRHWAALTDQPLPLVAISRGGTACKGIDASYGPEDLILAWP